MTAQRNPNAEAAPQRKMPMRFDALAMFARPVRNVELAVAFYRDALGFVPLESNSAAEQAARAIAVQLGDAWGLDRTPSQWAMLTAGDQRLLLVACEELPPADPDSGGTDVRFQHIAVVVGDMDAAWRRLLHCHPDLRCVGHGGPQQLPASSGGVTAVKFRDMDGHPVELLEFPPGQLPAYWQSKVSQSLHGEPTVGIDHSAISVTSTDASIRFYKQEFGLQLANRQTNNGPAQAQLDGIADPVVEVVALHAQTRHTPHLELLGYTQPAATTGMAQASVRLPRTTLVWHAQSVEAKGAEEATNATVRWATDPDGHPHIWLPHASASGVAAASGGAA
jgi:catechol 2,3-dioxygenase-like lactoylglutathione lyase family enzyme